MRILVCSLASSLCLFAQEPEGKSHLHVRLAFGGGEWEHKTVGSTLDDETDAGFVRLDVEATSRRGYGGGLRFEGLRTDDDLFVDAGFAANEARLSSIYLHFTYRAQAERFAMPVRIGFVLEGYQLEEEVTNDEITFASLGPYLELAPEVSIVASKRFSWSVYGEAGVGIAGTGIDVENDDEDYSSATVLFGAEVGTRLRVGPVELGVAVVGRWRSMDESDEENGFVVFGYDAEFRGLVISGGVVF